VNSWPSETVISPSPVAWYAYSIFPLGSPPSASPLAYDMGGGATMRCALLPASSPGDLIVAVDMLRFALAAYPEERVFMEPMVSLRWSALPRLLLLMLPLLLAVSAPLPFDVGAGLAAAA
jgi:hypothetical protein